MIVALAGRRVDAAGAATRRFPADNVAAVADRLRAAFETHAARALVSSAACGADLVALRVARELGIRRVVVLPFPPPVFRERSVVDRPGDWGPAFDEVVADVERDGALVVLGEDAGGASGTGAYERTNLAIAERALALARAEGTGVVAVAAWDGTPRGADDMTAHFVRAAEQRGFPVVAVPTL